MKVGKSSLYSDVRRLLIYHVTYDLYFLITTNKDIFGIISIQTDDTIILVDKRFLAREKEELK
jgi:hypothetical protein